MKNWLRMLTFSIFACFATACAVSAPAEELAAEAEQTLEAAEVALGDQVDAKASPSTPGTEDLGPCPPPGTCERANILCQDPQTTPSWCAILTRCLECGSDL